MIHANRIAVALFAALATPALGQPSYLNFESGAVRPMAMSADGTRLYAVNTPDNRLEIFDVSGAAPLPSSSVQVGMEPVAVAVRSNGDVWVVNHLSDSVSIVDPVAGRVVRTLLVGDEPRDVVFAGPGFDRAFITTAHRGQHRSDASIAAVPGAGDPQLTTEGIGRADVWVFDAANLGTALGGVPLAIVVLFGDTPRGLAASPDGSKVYAAVHYSGNQTMSLNDAFICEGFEPFTPCPFFGPLNSPGGHLGPPTNHEGLAAPQTSMILEFDAGTGRWRDELLRDWNPFVRFNLPDKDVFEIDATTLAETAFFTGVGTTNFNLVVHPSNGTVYASNTEAKNTTRFEGPGEFGGSTVQGELARSRITVIAGGVVSPRHLNKHIDYSVLAHDKNFDPSARLHSLATPLEMVISSDGSTLYVAAFGSSRVGVYSTAQLDADTFVPQTASQAHIPVSGGGPAGLVLDETNDRMFVWTRFDNGISTVDLTSGSETHHTTFHTPEPDDVVEGRPFLYDAFFSSANGEASCASCHIFGDMDHIAWNLGNPDDNVVDNPIPILNPGAAIFAPSPINGTGVVTDFHPMKGPMTTQTLRGLSTHGAMHWRGDRSNGFFGIDPFDEELSFDNFIVAFEGLLGREALISNEDMQRFTDFAMSIRLPPNPVRSIDNQLNAAQTAARDFWFNDAVDGARTCNDCHTLDPLSGLFATGRTSTFEGNSQIFKVAHLRNAYQKVGMFGLLANFGGGVTHTGDQVRGFGYDHAGSVDTLFRFVSGQVFNFPDEQSRRDMEEFVLAFDTDLAPIVGQQVTLDATNTATAGPRIDLMIQRASTPFVSGILGGTVAGECEVIAKGTVGGASRGWLRLASGMFQADDDPGGTSLMTDAALRNVASTDGPLTYTCVPPGSGPRMAINRDEDLFLDGVDNCPAVANDDQADLDSDTIGDACDPLSCGDGFVGALEECDDGGTSGGDGCDSSCQLESGAACEGEPSLCFFDTAVAGRKLILKRSASGEEKLVLVLKDPALPFPAIGSADDPANGTPGGLTLELLSLGEGSASIAVPPGESDPPGWKVRDGNTDFYRYKNRDAPTGPTVIKTAKLKQGKLVKIVGKDTGLPLSRAQGVLAVRVTTGKIRTCAVFSGAAVVRDEDGVFIAKNSVAAGLSDCRNATLGIF